MAYTGPVADRPSQLKGDLQTWSESTDPNALVRSGMDGGQTIKVRRRVTAPIRQGNASVTVRAADVPYWAAWYLVNCQNGVLPTRLRFPPACSEQIWRFASPLVYEWITAGACRISFALEKLPQWVD